MLYRIEQTDSSLRLRRFRGPGIWRTAVVVALFALWCVAAYVVVEYVLPTQGRMWWVALLFGLPLLAIPVLASAVSAAVFPDGRHFVKRDAGAITIGKTPFQREQLHFVVVGPGKPGRITVALRLSSSVFKIDLLLAEVRDAGEADAIAKRVSEFLDLPIAPPA